MECNKDEALRAKQIAEKKMENNDFEGARKIAMKAQNLFPDIENITQLLTVCSVHCSAQNRVGSEKDWYGILQVEKFADLATVKKQYRRLALLLHPDKNNFHGAEAAFKLIGEANMILSDSAKKSTYDTKIRISSAKTAPANSSHQQFNASRDLPKTAPANSSHQQLNAFRDVPNVTGLNVNQYQTMLPKSSPARQPGFWTSCPFCHATYQYLRIYMNKALRCPNSKCAKPFIAYERAAPGLGAKTVQTGVQNAPSRSGHSQPSGYEVKGASNLGAFKVAAQNTTRSSASHSGPLGSASNGKIGSGSGPQGEMAAGIDKDLQAKEKDSTNAPSVNVEKAKGGMPNEDAMGRKSGNAKNKSKKRGRKVVVESSESSGRSNPNSENAVIDESFDNDETVMDSGLNGLRRLRRRAQPSRNVSSNKAGFASPLKKSCGNKLSGDGKKDENEPLNSEVPKCCNPSTVTPAEDMAQPKVEKVETHSPEGNLRDENEENRELKVKGQPSGVKVKGEPIDILDDSSDEDKKIYEMPDPEFHDFDKIREEKCFSVGQIWACYDTLDCMPRYYAQIKKITTPRFKLRIDWLEANPDGGIEAIRWANAELPVGCGRFMRGQSSSTSELCTFSHQVLFEKGKSRGSILIYPRKGEIWALFKNWNIKWSANPENHKNFKYEIVEVMSNWVDSVGIEVAYLDKVEGFLSLFQRPSQSEIVTLLIPQNELLRFSHQIPFFKMTGREKPGVPEGSFELDSASVTIQG